MSNYCTVTIDHVRACTHTVNPDPAFAWMPFGEERDDPFILRNPGTDSLRVVEARGPEWVILCNQWSTATMPAPAFWYFQARMIVTTGPLPLEHDETAALHANYNPTSQTVVVGGKRFPFTFVSQAISQGISTPEKPAPALPSPLLAALLDPCMMPALEAYAESKNANAVRCLENARAAVATALGSEPEPLPVKIADPTRDEMLAMIAAEFEWLGYTAEEPCMKGDAEAAIYWFANDYHGGQDSNLYSALSTSPFRPGPSSTLESEGDEARMMYDALVAQFIGADSPDDRRPV